MAEVSTSPVVKTEAEAPARQSDPLHSLRREMDRLLEDFSSVWRGWPSGRGLLDLRAPEDLSAPGGFKLPDVDIEEGDEAFLITAEMPGVSEKNVDVTLADGVITIKGEQDQKTERKDKNFYLSERRFGSFRRSVRIPDSVDQDRIEAAIKDGVLTVTLPKSAEAKRQARKVAVKGA